MRVHYPERVCIQLWVYICGYLRLSVSIQCLVGLHCVGVRTVGQTDGQIAGYIYALIYIN